MSKTFLKMLELSADWDHTESIVQACADYCDAENKRLRELPRWAHFTTGELEKLSREVQSGFRDEDGIWWADAMGKTILAGIAGELRARAAMEGKE